MSPEARVVVEEFLARQRAMYAGGDLAAVEELLADDVVWHVPGTSPIAGDHRGRAAVCDYFRRRRDLAGGEIRIAERGQAHHEEALVQLADGRARLAGEEVVWRTAGVYRVAGGRIAEAWLVPLDQEQFDRAWAGTRPAPHACVTRLRAEDLAGGTLAAPRLLELLEAALAECRRDRGLDGTPALAAVDLRCLRPVADGDELRVEVALDRVADNSIRVHYDAFVHGARVAEATASYDLAPRRTADDQGDR